ncbi:MAG: AAA domain-containing protein [Candidatus Micrarchaeota archaeon]
MASEYTTLIENLANPQIQEKVSVPKVLEVLRDQLTDVSKKNRSLHLARLNMKLHFDLFELFDENKAEAKKLAEKITNQKPLRLVKVITPKEDEMAASYRLTHLQREADFIEKETGNYDVFIGYPFVEGKFGDGTHFKCPLVLFPVSIEKDYKKLEFAAKPDLDRLPILNKTFIIAYQKFNRIKFDPEYDFEIEEGKEGFIESAMEKCEGLGIRFDGKPVLKEGIIQYETTKGGKMDPGSKTKLRNFAVLGLFPQTSSTLLSDYESLIKESPKSGLLFDFFNGEAPDKSEWLKPDDQLRRTYGVTSLDGSQERALLSLEKLGGIAVHGPPGTGKSQLIVNVIADNVAKGKRVLLVCEKRAALDVVYNRLSAIGLGDMVALVHDYGKDRRSIYTKASRVIDNFNSSEELPQISIDDKGERSEELLGQIVAYHQALNTKLSSGSTPKELYSLDKDPLLASIDLNGLEGKFSLQQLHETLEKFSEILPMMKVSQKTSFKTISQDKISSLSEEKLREAEIHLRELSRIHETLTELFQSPYWASLALVKKGTPYPKSLVLESQILSLPKKSKALLKFADAKWRESKSYIEAIKGSLKEEKFPFELILRELSGEQLKFQTKTYGAIIKLGEYNKLMQRFQAEASALESILGLDFASDLTRQESVSSETAGAIMLQLEMNVKNKEKSKIVQSQLEDLSANEKKLLDIALDAFETEKSATGAISAIRHTFYYKWIFSAENDFPILKKLDRKTYDRYRREAQSLLDKRKHKSRQEVRRAWHENISKQKYSNLKEMKFQCEKDKQPWSIRKFLREFDSKGAFDLFPVWLASPETVSSIFPLKQGLFDTVIFDEASQCPLEHAIPSLFRGKSVLVAGDEKQLPPFDLFESYLDSEDGDEDDSKSASELREVMGIKSFLQLSKRRYPELLLNWHYRSRREELISFSNFAFYGGKIHTIASAEHPKKSPAIEWVKVDGTWDKRRNRAEAQAIVNFVAKEIAKPSPPSIGIVTFNSAQRDLIENLFEKRAMADYKFYINYKREKERVQNEEIQSLFVKNIENVQGDERDMIIFSIGYAPSAEDGKVLTQFGTLSMEGGENRLNVAITRAREKIFVFSSIEPQQLKITDESNVGGQLLRKYLEYAKFVSEANTEQVSSILRTLDPQLYEKSLQKQHTLADSLSLAISESLRKTGLEVTEGIGLSNYSLDLAIVDKDDKHRFSLGIEIDKHPYSGLLDAKERDVYRQNLLESKGWKIYRISPRDWWSDSDGIIREIKQELKSS